MNPLRHRRSLATAVAAAFLALAGTAPAVQAQQALPIPAPAQQPYPGTVQLRVDATDQAHRLFRVQQVLPVQPGRLTLLHPRWLPGYHGPYGDVSALAGLQMRAGGQRLPWMRDTLDTHAFHVDIPPGVQQLELEFQFLAPTTPGEGLMYLSPTVIGVEWNRMLLYPAGHAARQIAVQASLKLPAGWQHGSAMVAQRSQGGWVDFAPVSLESLVDSPVYAGRVVRRVELEAAGAAQPVSLHLFADEAESLQASDAQLDAHRRLVQQADRLFGTRPFSRYQFLLVQSDHFGATGLEHQQSSQNAVKPGYFKDWELSLRDRELLPHEYVHAWNGKFRRPADLDTPNFNVPMRNSLLWVYEGLTEYWGRVLAARSGLALAAQTRDRWAREAAYLSQQAGRAWRPLQDTTTQPTLGTDKHLPWYDWQRGWEYYSEGSLLWLDVDTLIREKSGDARSLDDLARGFFGVEATRAPEGGALPLSYRFEDLVAALNAVQPHDWARFLRERLDRAADGPGALLDGLARAGWTLQFEAQPSAYALHEAQAEDEPRHDFRHSLGLRIGKEGKLVDVSWEGPAFQAGLAPGMQLVAVNQLAYKPERLVAAVAANTGGLQPIELLVKDGERYRSLRLDYRGGARHPVLVRSTAVPDRLAQILAPR